MAWPEFVARGYLRKLLRPIAGELAPMGSAAAPEPPRLALLTSCGVHRAGDQPFDVASPDGDPTFREVGWDDDVADWIISHPHFDHALLEADFELAIPRAAVDALRRDGRVASVHALIPTFMGFVRDLKAFQAGAGEVADRLSRSGVEAALLTPC